MTMLLAIKKMILSLHAYKLNKHICLVLLFVMASSGWAKVSEASPSREYQIKAAILLNFTKFAKWPEPQIETGNDIYICVLAGHPFEGFLTELATMQKSADDKRKIHVKELKSNELAINPKQTCQILFLHRAASNFTGIPLDTLVVGEDKKIEEPQLHFNMKLNSDQVRLEVNLDNLSNSGIQISSRLLNLARKKIGSLK